MTDAAIKRGRVQMLVIMGIALVSLGGAYLLKGAAAAAGPDADRRTALARYFFGREFPALDALCEAAMDGAAPLYALSAEELAS